MNFKTPILFIVPLALFCSSIAFSTEWDQPSHLKMDLKKMMTKTQSPKLLDTLKQIQTIADQHPHNLLIQNEISVLIGKLDNINQEQKKIRLSDKAWEEIRSVLAFKVVQEDSDLAKGFPKPGPLGEIQIKDYPEYRMAVTQKGWFEVSAFFRLFNHIKDNDISMTVPVEMKYEEHSNDVDNIDMGFIYANTDTGELQNDGSVKVLDYPATTVVCVGLNGKRNDKRIKHTSNALRKWLQDNHPEYEIKGRLRVYAYNSPMVPKEKNYFEVQYPIQKIEQ